MNTVRSALPVVLHRQRVRTLAALAIVAAVALLTWAAVAVSAGAAVPPQSTFNRPGNVLIADQFNNRVIEVAQNGRIVWHFGNGSDVAGTHSVVAPNDTQRLPGGLTLIAGSGAPPGAPGYPAGGAPDSRVLIVNQAGNIVWQYGKAGVTGTGFNRLDTPVQATYLPNKDVLITDQGNARVIMVNPAKHIVWQYGKTALPGASSGRLNDPNSAELLPNGNILIADEGNNRVIEVTKGKHIVWSYGSPSGSQLNAPAFASRLRDGHTLIADGGNNRVVEVTMAKHVVWRFRTNTRAGSVADPAPSQAVRLRNGDTVISDQFNNQVIEVSLDKMIVWSYGQIGVAGNQWGQLNAPYGAKVIGDYTGLTNP